MNTHFLGRTHSVAKRLEERLDYYNAKNNLNWKPFRETIAMLKLFTDVSYITLHLKSAAPGYMLLDGIEKFLSDTNEILWLYTSALFRIFDILWKNAQAAGLVPQTKSEEEFSIIFNYPEGRLPGDLKKTKTENPGKIIVNLASSYLNLESESTLLRKVKKHGSTDYKTLVPDLISENSIRILEAKFHNLQSQYDTYLSNTDIEDTDSDLKLMRGHVSVVYHLLEAATGIIHYYERHMMHLPEQNLMDTDLPISTEKLLDILVDYYLNYSEQFLTSGKNLCKQVIRKYAEEGVISVKVPEYRGFHVRPSTLVAKIVQHYGSEVKLVVGNEKYDASSPMNLFRVNEMINAEKRRNLAKNISLLKSVSKTECNGNFERGLREIFHELLEGNKIINYSAEFSMPELESIPEETLGEFANRVIANFLAQGKIDLKTDMEVHFEGDKRVLADLEILAECGYGEDSYGNNTILPEELSYIRR